MKITTKLLSFLLFPFLVLITHLVASKVLHLYLIFPNLDIPFHFIGGFSIAYMASQIFTYLEHEKLLPNTLPKNLLVVLLFSLTATATVLWEFAEFIIDQVFNMNIQISLANTMQDQFMGLLGGLAWIFIFIGKLPKVRERNITNDSNAEDLSHVTK